MKETTHLSLGEVRAWITGHGLTYTEIASRLGVDRHDLQAVFSGRYKGRRGKPFRIQVGLRLRSAPTNASQEDFALPPPKTVRKWIAENGIDTTQYEPGKYQHRSENIHERQS